jgi:hypothetical protein
VLGVATLGEIMKSFGAAREVRAVLEYRYIESTSKAIVVSNDFLNNPLFILGSSVFTHGSSWKDDSIIGEFECNPYNRYDKWNKSQVGAGGLPPGKPH